MTRFDLFPAPVFLFQLSNMEALNRELSAILLEEEKISSGLQRSNFGGWHSNMDLVKRPQTCFQVLLQATLDRVREAVTRLTSVVPPPAPALSLVHAWAMIMRDGDYTIVHDHGEAAWSTVYYVDAGDSADDAPSGALAFSDTRPGVRPMPELGLFPAMFTLQPRDGDLVIFPGWLRHQVSTYQGKRPRISIAANVVMEAPAPSVSPSHDTMTVTGV